MRSESQRDSYVYQSTICSGWDVEQNLKAHQWMDQQIMLSAYSRVYAGVWRKEILSSVVNFYFSLSNRKIAILNYPALTNSWRFTSVTKQLTLHLVTGKMRRHAVMLSFSSERTIILNKIPSKFREKLYREKKAKSLTLTKKVNL